MFENIILGIIQGVAEWLPVSSEGLIFLVKNNFFSQSDFSETASIALFLHFGTFLAALLYFRKDIVLILKKAFVRESEESNIFRFLLISTLISGGLGFFILQVISELEEKSSLFGGYLNFFIGFLLIGTGFLQMRAKRDKKGILKKAGQAEMSDGTVLGFIQALAVLPGFSRSGLTVSALLLSGFEEKSALRLSFLMSLPLVLGGNIILNLDKFSLDFANSVGLFFSFIFGLLTISFLLKIAEKINFARFVIAFGLLMILASFL